jgi:modification methylase
LFDPGFNLELNLVVSKYFNKIIIGDCLRELKKIPDKSFELVFADPPYNMQIGETLRRPDSSKVKGVNDKWDQFESFKHYDDFCKTWLAECKRILKDNGSIWVIGSYHNIFRLGYHLQNLNYWLLNDVIWRKNNPMPNFRGTRFTNAHETLIWASKNKDSKYTFNYQSLKCLNDDLQMRSDWMLPICNGKERLKKRGKKIHSTQKPESLLHRILLATTNKGDAIFDPFLGTGTSAVVAKKLGRKYFGIERDKKYFKAANERINKTKVIKEDYLDVIENNKSKPRIPFGSLVELGILKPGTILFDPKKKFNAKIMVDGSIKSKEAEGSIHKVAAKIMGTESCNGWTYWHCNLDGSTVLIDSLRQKFISQKRI